MKSKKKVKSSRGFVIGALFGGILSFIFVISFVSIDFLVKNTFLIVVALVLWILVGVVVGGFLGLVIATKGHNNLQEKPGEKDR